MRAPALALLLSSIAAHASVSAPPAAPAPTEVKRAKNPKALANRYLVILSAASELDAKPEVLAALKAAGIALHPMALSTTDFKGLRPCLQVLAVGAFASKKQAVAYAAKLESAGVKPSVRNTGKFVGDDPIRLASCAAPAQAVTATEPPRFVEVWLGRGFLPLEGELPPSKPVKQSEDDRHVWLGESDVREWTGAKVGDAWDVYANARFVQTCQVKGFLSLVREYAPFPLEESPPTEPSCGSPEPFAELDCAPKGDEVFFALKHGTRAPEVWVEDPAGNDDHGVERELRENEHFLAAQRESKEAATRSTPYKETVTTRVFKGSKSTVVLVEGEILTGEGNQCSSEDMYARFRLAVQFDGGGKATDVVPFAVVSSGEEFVAFTDTDGDGLAELLVRRGNTDSALNSNGERLSGKSIPYCGSDC